MTQRTVRSLMVAALFSPALVGCVASSDGETSAAEPAPVVVTTYTEGQLITMFASVARPGDEAAAVRKGYFERIAPITTDLGFSRDVGLRVTETVVGSFEPEAMGFFSWPSADAENVLNQHPDWSKIKELRPQAWDQLRLYSKTLDEDLTLTFDSGKHYTVAVAWFDPDHPELYDQYLDDVEPTLTKLNARYIYKMRMPRFETHTDPNKAPGQLTFVEWDTREGLNRFIRSRGFLKNYSSLQEGTVRFELHRIEPVVPG
ncbi:MAG: hypothetical protein AAFR65_12725 [Pseudomonadota bacterium]